MKGFFGEFLNSDISSENKYQIGYKIPSVVKDKIFIQNSGFNRIYILSAPWTVVFAGLAIVMTVVCFNIIGDALRDRLDCKIQ